MSQAISHNGPGITCMAGELVASQKKAPDEMRAQYFLFNTKKAVYLQLGFSKNAVLVASRAAS